MQHLTLGQDASWTGWGICLANQDGPIRVGHLALGPPNRRPRRTQHNPDPQLQPTHRPQRLRAFLDGPLEHLLCEAQLLRGPGDPLVRVAIEVPPLGFRRGQPSAYVGVGRLVGALELWATRSYLLAPWVLEPGPWRAWWGIAPTRKGRGSAELKADAIRLVERTWGPAILQAYRRTAKGGPRGDVAEAILIAVGASRHPEQAPPSPLEWPDVPEAVWKNFAI